MEWISVKDELPKIEKDVLFYCYHEYEDENEYFMTVGYVNQSGEIQLYDFVVMPTITDWQHLPEPPNQ